jgi:DNA-directed RNA polymerase specialized sigma24 family protein/ribosome-associated translation inhibitor RaiA
MTMLENRVNSHIVPRLTGIGAERSEIAAVIRKQGAGRDAYRIKLRMHVPPKMILVSESRAKKPETAIDEAVNSLLGKVADHINRVRRQESSKRLTRRARLKNYRARQDTLPTGDINDATALIDTLLPKLERAVKRELVFLQSQGDLPPDYPTVQDIVDEVVAAVLSDWKTGMDSHAAYLRMLKKLHRVLDKEVQASRTFGEMVPLEKPAPLDPADQAENMVGEEFYEFRQPDELLRIEDVIGDEASGVPATGTRDDQKAGYTLRLFKDLPIAWRRALMLHELDDISEEETATILGIDLPTLTARISQANHYIRARLTEAGFEAQTGSLLSVFRYEEPE